MQTTTIALGQFEVNSAILKIVDPFEKNNSENLITDVKNGVWHAQVTMIENLGNANITLFHEDYINKNSQFNAEGYVESLSGYLACVDYDQYQANIQQDPQELNDKMEEIEASIMDMGVASKTGMKPGSYQVQTITEDDKVIALRLVFIETEITEANPSEEELAETV